MMRRVLRSGIAAWLAVLCVLAPLAALGAAAEDLAGLGFDREQVELALFGALRGAYQAPDVPKDVRALPAEQKVAAVQTLGAFAKAYLGSAEFKKAYAEAYKNSKPRGFSLPSLNVKQMGKDAATEKVTGQKKTPDAWRLDKNPKVQLQTQLQSFVNATADVDYAATTHENGSLKIFDKTEYEAKPREWKLCYRAGRETGEAIRAFAENWLAELKETEPKR